MKSGVKQDCYAQESSEGGGSELARSTSGRKDPREGGDFRALKRMGPQGHNLQFKLGFRGS